MSERTPDEMRARLRPIVVSAAKMDEAWDDGWSLLDDVDEDEGEALA